MNHNQEKIKNASQKITILLKVVLFASVLSTLLALAGRGISLIFRYGCDLQQESDETL